MKKIISALCLLLSALLVFGSLGMLSVFADETPEEAEEVTLEKKDVNAYVFTEEDTITIECVFRSDLPDVPYIDPVDYVNGIYTDPFTVDQKETGSYTIVNANDETMVVDPVNDTVYFEKFDDFMSCNLNEEGSSIEIDFVNYVGTDVTADPQPITVDLGAYGIDVIELDGKVYLPLTVIAMMFSTTYNNALYFEENICFVHTFDPESYFDEFDLSSIYVETERTAAMAQFDYAALCISFDYFYGKPSNTVLAEYLETMTLDEALDACDEYTQFAKQLLLSENKSEYLSGLSILSYYVYDGGHTVLSNIPVIAVNYYYGAGLPDLWYDDISGYTDLADAVWACLEALFSDFDYIDVVNEQRDEAYATYADEVVLEWEESGAYLIIHGDTAVFVFDSFEIDTPDELKAALDYAEEQGVKNFIIDDSCNGGGYVAACNYIVALISNAKYHTNTVSSSDTNPLTGAIYTSTYEIDLNLDGVFDEEDAKVYYDFNFAILTSYASFSCGNKLPIEAQTRGILIFGENSGGGSCIVSERYTADGYAYPISDIDKSITADGGDFDNGATPYVELVTVDDEGDLDFSQMYDIDGIAALMEDYYAQNPYGVDVDAGIEPMPIVLLIVSLALGAAIVIFRKRANRFPEK